LLSPATLRNDTVQPWHPTIFSREHPTGLADFLSMLPLVYFLNHFFSPKACAFPALRAGTTFFCEGLFFIWFCVFCHPLCVVAVFRPPPFSLSLCRHCFFLRGTQPPPPTVPSLGLLPFAFFVRFPPFSVLSLPCWRLQAALSMVFH